MLYKLNKLESGGSAAWTCVTVTRYVKSVSFFYDCFVTYDPKLCRSWSIQHRPQNIFDLPPSTDAAGRFWVSYKQIEAKKSSKQVRTASRCGSRQFLTFLHTVTFFPTAFLLFFPPLFFLHLYLSLSISLSLLPWLCGSSNNKGKYGRTPAFLHILATCICTVCWPHVAQFSSLWPPVALSVMPVYTPISQSTPCF